MSCTPTFWEKPLLKLQVKYGVSAVAIGKVCRKLKVPLPGRGYWARKAFGKTVKQMPMPEFKDAPIVQRMKTNFAPKPTADSTDPELAKIAEVKSHSLQLLEAQHKFVVSCAGLLKRARTNEYGIIEPPSDRTCLSLRVSKELRQRYCFAISAKRMCYFCPMAVFLSASKEQEQLRQPMARTRTWTSAQSDRSRERRSRMDWPGMERNHTQGCRPASKGTSVRGKARNRKNHC
jgi:hypothetical protein